MKTCLGLDNGGVDARRYLHALQLASTQNVSLTRALNAGIEYLLRGLADGTIQPEDILVRPPEEE